MHIKPVPRGHLPSWRGRRPGRMTGRTSSGAALVNLVSNNSGIALRLVNTGVRYWAAYPSEVDAEIAAADAAQEAAEQAWLRERRLLAG
jgi:hypothetical protein